ncbi:MAG: hypothetical protein MUP03_07305 [Anaerolineales bacterium]|nr:hypothetical protein [Anaerolineales bacterium]
MNNRRIIIVMAIAVCLLTALACSVSPAIPKTTGKIGFVAEKTTIELWVDSTTITKGQCTVVHWRTWHA